MIRSFIHGFAKSRGRGSCSFTVIISVPKSGRIKREEAPRWGLPDQSVASLSQALAANISSPSAALVKAELQQRVRASIEALSPQDCEVLVLRHLEQLPLAEVAGVLKITPAAVQSRYRRAIERLHKKLTRDAPQEGSP